jgi:hypothetical protein
VDDVGRRGGKSRISALVALYLACFRDYEPHLAPGEVGTLAVIAAGGRDSDHNSCASTWTPPSEEPGFDNGQRAAKEH